MARPPAGDLSITMTVLGLAAQRPDSVAGLKLRLEETLPRANIHKSSTYNALTRLAERGCVRQIGESAEASNRHYEATVEGVAEFRSWVRRMSATPTALRDALHVQLELLERKDLPELLKVVREEEAACAREFTAAQARLGTMRLERRRAGGDVDWRTRVRVIMLTDETMLWGTRTNRLQRLQRELEELAESAGPSEGGVGDG